MSGKWSRLPRRGGEMSIQVSDVAARPSLREKHRRQFRPTLRVAIAGGGLITPLGHSAAQTWNAICRGERITDHTKVHKRWGGRSRVGGLAIDAATEAINDAGWTADELNGAALVVGTSKGPIIDWIDNRNCGRGIGDLSGEIAAAFGLQGGPRLTVSAACASGLHALIRGALMIRAAEAQRALVVAAEASVHELFLASFKRLGVLAKVGDGCRPFDQARSGFVMSEAGAAICLEGESGDTGGRLTIENMAMGGDSTHMISGDCHATTLRSLLRETIGIQPVDLIHAHGTGTIQNDEIELSAIEDCIEGMTRPKPALYSHKGAIGHSLGAAGLISIVLNRLCHGKGLVPPSAATNTVKMRSVSMPRELEGRSIKRSIAMAAGFGGAIAVVSLVSP
jgi:3-oxoacyl-[acyl-carrier-protein] synthase II